jgi:hypothetical protein
MARGTLPKDCLIRRAGPRGIMPIPGPPNKPPGNEAMRPRRRGFRPAAALAALWLAGGAAGASSAAGYDRLVGYADFRFGMSVAEAAAVIGQAQPVAEEDGVQLIETAVRVAGLPAQRRLLFVEDRLTSIVFRWEPAEPASGDGKARCRALYDRFHDQLAGRYGTAALGPHQTAEGEAAYAGLSFWSFADAASISLIVVRDPGKNSRCRATLNYKEPPAGEGG